MIASSHIPKRTDCAAARKAWPPVALCAAMLLLASPPASAGPTDQQDIAGVGITERHGETVPFDIQLLDEAGNTVRFGDYFRDDRPVVLSLVYYECPGTCTAVLSGLVGTLQQMETPGDRFQVVTVSFNHRESPQLAAEKKAAYLDILRRPDAAPGWVFLTGDEANLRRLTDAVGFGHRWIPDTQQYAHDMALIVIGPDGRVSRYLRGAFYDPQTLRLSIVEASGGKVGTISERIWVTICGYDPRFGRYVVMAATVMKIGGALTVGALVAILGVLWLREFRRRKVTATHGQPGPA